MLVQILVVDVGWWLGVKVLDRDQGWHPSIERRLHGHLQHRGPDPPPHLRLEDRHLREVFRVSMETHGECCSEKVPRCGPDQVATNSIGLACQEEEAMYLDSRDIQPGLLEGRRDP